MIKISILSVLLPDLVYTIVRSTTEIIPERNTNNNNNNDECGITSYYTDSTNSLIPNGEYALPGQWPWVVALNVNNKSRFECTGSILTNRHILTAANCLGTNGVKYNNMKVALGQFKLRGRRVVGTVNRKVASYIIHPDWDGVSSDSDLAIWILRRPVEFSPFIRPICLWSGSTDIENVVNRIGYDVGWALNESNFHVLVSEPRMLKMPIVNRETCTRLWSDQIAAEFYDLSNRNTFCAGCLGESGPCYDAYGSVGSGLVLFNNSTAATCLELNTKYNDIMKVALGQFNLRHGSRVVGTVNRKVEWYKIHPNANWRTGDSDLAILILSMPVEFSPFIRPICLWSGSTDIEHVVDRTGYVVGWAFNESTNHVLVSEPRMLKMPIVNQTCLRSHDNHSSLTIFTEGTFCGYIGSLGLSGETNPCYGDIGSGLVLFDNSTGRYQLRGILSQFNLHRNRDWCGVGKYINYVDMANNTLWIQQQISTT